MLLLVAASVCTSSCNKDDEEDVTSVSIVGTWSFSAEDGNYTVTETYVFNSNLTGSHSERIVYTDNGQEVSNDRYNFEYNISENSEGLSYVTIVREEGSSRWRYEITNSRLLLFNISGEPNTYSEFRKQ